LKSQIKYLKIINQNIQSITMNKNIIKEELIKCKNKINKDFFVIGLGGIESWAVALSAIECFDIHNVLCVNIYSSYSNSMSPHKFSTMCQTYGFQYCDVDISKAITETLFLQIDLLRIEKEKLHYTMTDMQKYEMISMIRNTVLKGISDRNDAILLSGISESKIKNAWVSPSCSMFDWNPVYNLSHKEIKDVILDFNIGTEIIGDQSGLDLNSLGGPFPKDYNINLEEEIKENKSNIKGLGLGIYQEFNQ